ncbi:SNF2 domain-containing protein [Chloropicon primus]|uniref:SNF2 domain-containing protein n=2 Tax=Chloropicon primus TaxID=1764295 RepID=A0A5B8MU52_9CHLO|nr:SNF2 domain-containing protein [Chloropicon primus]UPR03064.1 SNF2 domain-containing protein [Chloropicon primus]|eukprot:QDZ23851.1 SNF2 domain-containing protein [Chloropicon primus]
MFRGDGSEKRRREDEEGKGKEVKKEGEVFVVLSSDGEEIVLSSDSDEEFEANYRKDANHIGGAPQQGLSGNGFPPLPVNPLAVPPVMGSPFGLFQAIEVDLEGSHRAENEVLYGILEEDVVGLRHYEGTVHLGEFFDLVRDPNNSYDRNAIMVNKMNGTRVGHVNRTSAAFMAPLMDEELPEECPPAATGCQNKVPNEEDIKEVLKKPPSHLRKVKKYRIEVSCECNPFNRFTFKGTFKIFGHPDHLESVKQHLSRYEKELRRLDVKRELPPSLVPYSSSSGASTSSARRPFSRGSYHSGVFYRRREERKPFSVEQLDEFFDSQLKKKEAVAAEELDFGCIKATLLEHQKEAVAWMYGRETKPDGGGLPPFYELRKEAGHQVFFNSITNSSDYHRPSNVRGGILADDMGLGKTIQVLCLMAMTRREAKNVERPTLVVCPLSVIHNWESQVAEHLHPGALRVLVYHGQGRNKAVKDIPCDYDLVITTYQTLGMEIVVKKGKRLPEEERVQKKSKLDWDCLIDIKWKRIVLDEAHIIRNRATRGFSAAALLEGETRWCLTGTPYVNKPGDIQSLCAFLKSSPLNHYPTWNRAIGDRLRYGGDPVALGKLRVLLSAICMRRTKDLLKDKLPPKTVEMEYIKLFEGERETYDILFDGAKILFESLLALDQGGTEVMKNYSHVLECLLRLRQACCYKYLIPEKRIAGARRVVEEYAKKVEEKNLTMQEIKELQEMLQGTIELEGEDAECCICFDVPPPESVRILAKCKHTLCQVCLEKLGQYVCPLCRTSFRHGDIKSLEKLEREERDLAQSKKLKETLSRVEKTGGDVKDEYSDSDAVPSCPAKIAALVKDMKEVLKENPTQKFVVFSQFVDYLDVIGSYLSCMIKGMELHFLTGKMSGQQRSFSINCFGNPDATSPACLLVSVRAGGVGINLTCSNRAYLMDLWWNAAVEDQAMDRIHRIGQTQPVKVVRFVARGSVERKILEMQEGKKILGKGALQKVNSDEVRKARLDVLKGFFEKEHREVE